jgi:uncharacterized protein (TIGR02466 family)
MIVESWFPTLILQGKLDEFSRTNRLLSKRAYQIREEQQGQVSTQWNCDTFNTLQVDSSRYFKNDEVDKVINDLIDATTFHVTKYSRLYDADLERFKVICKEFWFNIAEPGNYQEYHSHPNNHFSAVYYVDADTNCGNIVFKNIESIVDSYAIPATLPVSSIGANKSCNYIPEPTKLLVFRSNLQHMVEKNLSNKDRISIAMNFELVRK